MLCVINSEDRRTPSCEVISDPEVEEVVLNDTDRFLVMASDGVFEIFNSDELVEEGRDTAVLPSGPKTSQVLMRSKELLREKRRLSSWQSAIDSVLKPKPRFPRSRMSNRVAESLATKSWSSGDNVSICRAPSFWRPTLLAPVGGYASLVCIHDARAVQSEGHEVSAVLAGMVSMAKLLAFASPVWAIRENQQFLLQPSATADTSCASHVKATLANLGEVTDIGQRIGAVLGAQEYLNDCCVEGTEFDTFVQAKASAEVSLDSLFDAQTALVVIDMQKDFTSGKIAGRVNSKMVEAIEKAAAAGSMIIASKDFHPSRHCSFGGEEKCSNRKDKNEAETENVRYVNEFPSHCSFTVSGGRAVPQKAAATPFCQSLPEEIRALIFCSDPDFVGTDFEPAIGEALSKVPAAQVEVMFKGFHEHYDSFSAMHHQVRRDCHSRTKDNPSRFTGSFALPAAEAASCHGKWDTDASCYPSKSQLDDSDGLRSFSSILSAKGIQKMVVVGLVYDYCVKETAIFTKENTDLEVTVLANLVRPSFDGKPGAPFTGFLCDGEDLGNGFCSAGGGTTAAHEKVLEDSPFFLLLLFCFVFFSFFSFFFNLLNNNNKQKTLE
ncbi:unnamed protein product [Effrenium voratum]|nr:unnamed protein product [Effrenium voratum]